MSFEVLEDKRVNIIIVGSGKVGYTLAQHLNAEGHEITVIDSDGEMVPVTGPKKKQALKKQTF